MTVLDFVDFELALSAFPQPANDDFANALDVDRLDRGTDPATLGVVLAPATIDFDDLAPGLPHGNRSLIPGAPRIA